MSRLFALLLLAACGQQEVRVTGIVSRGRVDRDDAEWPLSGGNIAIRDNAGAVYDEATTETDGSFVVLAPAGETIFAEISADGLAVSSFTGVSGLELRLRVEEGALYGVSSQEMDEWRTRFAGCPDAEEGRFVVGEVRVFGLEDSETGEAPLLTNAKAVTVSEEGAEKNACYLDETGAYSMEATETGDSGLFAIFGVAPGLHTLTVTYSVVEENDAITYAALSVPEDPAGVVPRFPVWVEFPY